MCLSPHHPHLCSGQCQFLHCSGNTYITKPPLLFHLIRIIGSDTHITGEQAILHTSQIDVGKFQPLCTVESHQQYLAAPLVHAVNVSHKSHFLQKSAQRHIFFCLFVSGSLADQFINILNSFSRFIRVLRFQFFHIAGLFYDIVQ